VIDVTSGLPRVTQSGSHLSPCGRGRVRGRLCPRPKRFFVRPHPCRAPGAGSLLSLLLNARVGARGAAVPRGARGIGGVWAAMKARCARSFQPSRRLRRRGTGVKSIGSSVTSTRPVTAWSGQGGGGGISGWSFIGQHMLESTCCRKALCWRARGGARQSPAGFAKFVQPRDKQAWPPRQTKPIRNAMSVRYWRPPSSPLQRSSSGCYFDGATAVRQGGPP
jgi:hypothetical protein